MWPGKWLWLWLWLSWSVFYICHVKLRFGFFVFWIWIPSWRFCGKYIYLRYFYKYAYTLRFGFFMIIGPGFPPRFVLVVLSVWHVDVPHLAHILQEPLSRKQWCQCWASWMFYLRSPFKEGPNPPGSATETALSCLLVLFYNLDRSSPLILALIQVLEYWRWLSFELWALTGKWEGVRMSRAIW